MTHEYASSRRDMLQLAGLAGAAMLVPAGSFAQAGGGGIAANAGTKFYPDGRVRIWPGNTIVHHLPQQGEGSACFNALLDVYRDIPTRGFARKLAILPPSSYHMTLFGGANDLDRRAEVWPSGMALDTPMAEVSDLVGARVKAMPLMTALPIRMRVDPTRIPDAEKPLKIRLLPLDAAEERKLRRLRDRLAEATGIRAPGHENYRFHISLAYLLDALNPGEAAEYRAAQREWEMQVAKVSPVIALGAPEFCVFKDMYAFERQFFLS